MRSITLIERDGERTRVLTLRPDGHVSGGTKDGALANNVTRELTPEALAEVFELAALPADVPTGPRGGGPGTVTLTIQREGARARQFAWATGVRPSDPRLLALLEAIETLRDRTLGGSPR